MNLYRRHVDPPLKSMGENGNQSAGQRVLVKIGALQSYDDSPVELTWNSQHQREIASSDWTPGGSGDITDP